MSDDEPAPFKTLQGKMLRYEGMTNSVNIYKYASWKSTCPAHERWDNVIKAENISAEDSVSEVIAKLKEILNVKVVEINMLNNKFIDKIISDRPEKVFCIKLPESKLDDYIKHNDELRKLSYKTLFHKSFIENIDDTFPYPEMSLKDVGIPTFDIMQVSTDKGQFFVELSKDASLYNLA